MKNLTYLVEKYPNFDMRQQVIEELKSEGIEECTVEAIIGFWEKDIK